MFKDLNLIAINIRNVTILFPKDWNWIALRRSLYLIKM